MAVEFRLLGHFEVEHGGRPLTVGRRRERCLLAILLLEANTAVPVERLTELLWDDARPRDTRATIHTYVSRLRTLLDPDGDGQKGVRLARTGHGYLLEVADDAVDARRFRALLEHAGNLRDPAERAPLLRRALRLWRGPMLADPGFEHLHDRLAAPWHEMRLTAHEAAIDAELACGRHHEVIGELKALIAEHPYRERLAGLTMLALYRAGRQAEAFEIYRQTRRSLVDHLGVEPGPELRRLHERILAVDADLLTPPAQSDQPPPIESVGARVPRQLPAGVRHFVGRAAELKALSEMLAQHAEAGSAVVICAIGGTAGIGKTALAIRWAQQHTDRFPDGQLYVNLRGFDPSSEPMAPAEAVRRFLDALGVPPQRIPADPDEQAALYRSESADRRMLIVLDNARDVHQVRPLLPGSPGCLVLVTSRNQLSALIALNDAVPLTLDLLTQAESRDLLARRLGHERLAEDERATHELINLCARLPLALNIAAARAALHPARTLAQLVDELRDTQRRLRVLTTGDPAADIRTVFSWSYNTLAPDTARVFRLLGVHPGPDINLMAAANLTALDPDHTRAALEKLTTAHLLTEYVPGRYSFHDLLRAYATDQADTHDTESHDALRRACDFYLHTAHAADRLLAPHRPRVRPDPPAPGTQLQPLPDERAALTWFQSEHRNLLAAQQAAAAHAWHLVVWHLAWTLTMFHRRRGHLHDELAVWQAALAAAEHLPDPVNKTLARERLGRACAELGRHEEAIEHLRQALALAERHDNPTEQAHTHLLLARACERQGEDRRALQHATRALHLYRTLDQPVWEADALNAVGWYAVRVGDYDTARTHCQAAVDQYRRLHNAAGEAATLDSLGYIEHNTGSHSKAVRLYQQAISLLRTLDDTYETADVLDHLSHSHAALGHHDEARAALQEALTLYRQQRRDQDAERIQRQLNALDNPNEQ